MITREAQRERERMPRSAITGSVTLHATVLAALLIGSLGASGNRPAPSYSVRLVAASDLSAPVRLKPQPAAVAEEENRPPTPEPTPLPKPETTKPTVVEERPPETPALEPSRGPEEGEEAINVQLEGALFVDPAYMQNIIRQVFRYWRPPEGSRRLAAELIFVIEKDGSVSEIDWKSKSGDLTFDLEARGAIEAAGQRQAFGPLPEAYPRDRLRVEFFFDPTQR